MTRGHCGRMPISTTGVAPPFAELAPPCHIGATAITRAAANGGRKTLSLLRVGRVRRLSRRVAPRADAAECRDQDPGGFPGAGRRHARHARNLCRELRRRRSFLRRHGRVSASVEQRRRPFATPTRACGSADRKGHGPRGAWAPDLYPMGSMARDRLQQGRRRTESRHRRARLWCETRRKIRTNGRYTRVPGRSSRTAQGDRFLSREAVHQR